MFENLEGGGMSERGGGGKLKTSKYCQKRGVQNHEKAVI